MVATLFVNCFLFHSIYHLVCYCFEKKKGAPPLRAIRHLSNILIYNYFYPPPFGILPYWLSSREDAERRVCDSFSYSIWYKTLQKYVKNRKKTRGARNRTPLMLGFRGLRQRISDGVRRMWWRSGRGGRRWGSGTCPSPDTGRGRGPANTSYLAGGKLAFRRQMTQEALGRAGAKAATADERSSRGPSGRRPGAKPKRRRGGTDRQSGGGGPAF